MRSLVFLSLLFLAGCASPEISQSSVQVIQLDKLEYVTSIWEDSENQPPFEEYEQYFEIRNTGDTSFFIRPTSLDRYDILTHDPESGAWKRVSDHRALLCGVVVLSRREIKPQESYECIARLPPRLSDREFKFQYRLYPRDERGCQPITFEAGPFKLAKDTAQKKTVRLDLILQEIPNEPPPFPVK